MSEENPICGITALDYTEEIPEDRGVQVTIVYENFGAAGPTFFRTRTPGSWDFKMAGDIEKHATGEPHGGHGYLTAPEGHLIFQVEVGYGTWLNPIKITDAATIVMIDPTCAPPEEDETEVIVYITRPPAFWSAAQTFWAEPGTVISAAWVNDNRDGEHGWRMNFQRTLSVGSLEWSWAVDGEPWTDKNERFEIGPRETQVIEMKATIPKNFKTSEISFMTYPVNRELVMS